MRNCSIYGCIYPVHGTDRITRIGYCGTHQYLRTDLDKRSPFQKHIEKQKENNSGKIIDNTSHSNLIDDNDFVFSRYIRLKYADENGMVKCFTCPEVLFWKEIQNGHYVSRSNQATRFLEDNCRPQCPLCNKIHNDNIKPFTLELEKERPGLSEWLIEQGRETYKATQDDLKQLLSIYKTKLRLVEKKIPALRY